MTTLLAIARKDLQILLRDRASLFWLFGLPLLFASFFGSVFGGGGSGSRPLTVCVVDEVDHEGSRDFVGRLGDNDAIELEPRSLDAARAAVRQGDATAYLRIVAMPGDGLGFASGTSPELEVGIDPSRQAEAGVLRGLLMEAVFGGFREVFSDPARGRDMARDALARVRADPDLPAAQRMVLATFFQALDTFLTRLPETTASSDAAGGPMQPEVAFVDVARRVDRPLTGYEVSFPQALAWGLMSAAAGLALSLVRERRDGTLLRLRTAPIGAATILGGKLAACFTAGIVVVAVVFAFGAVVFGVRIHDPLAVATVAVCASLSFAGLMMLLSTMGRTEQAVAGASWGLLLILAMIGGGMVPQFVMPDWMLAAGVISPVRWAIAGFEGATWRAWNLGRLAETCGVLLLAGSVAFTIGWLRLRREL